MISVLNHRQQLNGNNLIKMLMKNWKFQVFQVVAATFIVLFSLSGFGQSVQKSQIKETIDGKEYYLHFVKQGETLFDIARAYNITVDDIFKSNQYARDGIRSGNVLKIQADQIESSSAPESQKPKDEYFYHIVKKQETLYGLSKKYNVEIAAIQKLNPDSGIDLKEGATIKIPYAKEDKPALQLPASGNITSHTIIAGETLYGIAKNYNITTGEIINANPGIDPQDLDIGMKITIPNQKTELETSEDDTESPSEDFDIHTVNKGETLYSIAREYAIPIDTLKRYNVGLTVNLYIGQKIKIPASSAANDYLIYKPERKESIEDIAKKYRINSNEVKESNPGISKKVKRGELVKIPVAEPQKDEPELKEDSGPGEISRQRPDQFPCPQHPSMRLQTYNIALMLPLFLQEVDSLEQYKERGLESTTDMISFRFLNFYAGFKMAVDSMEKAGMKINLFIYDVDNDLSKTSYVLQKSELSSMDLIVGPLYAKSFARVANFAKTFQIPIVNPLSTRDEIIGNNPYVYKLKPAEDVQTDLMVNYLLENYPESNIVLVRHNKYKYQSAVSYIRNNLNAKRSGHVMIPNSHIAEIIDQLEETRIFTENKLLEKEMVKRDLSDSTYISNLVKEITYIDDSIKGLETNLSMIRNNVVVALSDEIVFTKDLMSRLNKLQLDHDITLFGLPDWNGFRELETNQMLNLNLHTFTSSIIDYQSPEIVNWIESYRMQYQTEPTPANYAFDGFDTGWYFLNALYRYGTGFTECIQNFQPRLIQTRFQFQSSGNNGFQNTYWNMGQYHDYQYKPVVLPDLNKND